MTIWVTVKPGSKKGPLVEFVDDAYVVYVREPAHDGLANTAVRNLLAKHFNVAKTAVTLAKGTTSKRKQYTIAGDLGIISS